MTPGDPVYSHLGIYAWMEGAGASPSPAVNQRHGSQAAGPLHTVGGRESSSNGHGAASSHHGPASVHHNAGNVTPEAKVQEVSHVRLSVISAVHLDHEHQGL